ncbi:MAG: aldo/keto reductase [Chlamydiae bacterium]|nr:aldo/keto reductase [Chlamydiota bacterium]MBI3267337.1 aldo/keto reductase [Chlamydiota bacterium]
MIPHRILGKTALSISELGFGSWPIGGGSYGPVEDVQSLEALREAMAHGVNFIDTADIYGKGHSESLIGEVVEGRDDVFLATKAGWDFSHGLVRANFDVSYLAFALEESLQRLKRNSVSLFQLHNPPVELTQNKFLLESLRKWKEKGKIDFYGVSVHGPEEGKIWIENTDVQVIQIVFNLLDQRPLRDFFGLVRERGVGIIAREPLACGMLTEKYSKDVVFPKNDHRRRWPKEKMELDLEKIRRIRSWVGLEDIPLSQLALEFVLSFREVSIVIPGMKTPHQVRSNLKACEEKHLNPELIQKICKLYREDEIFSRGLYRN